MPRLRAYLPALCAGVLTALCYPKPGLCGLAWFSLVPLFYSCSKAQSKGAAFLLGWIAGFGFHGAALYWVYSTCRFSGMAWPISVLAWILLALFLGLNWGVIAILGRFLAGRTGLNLKPWIWASAWTAVCFISERFTPRLGIDLLTYTQYRHLSLLQIGSLAGPHALGFVIVALNAGLAQAWEEFDANKTPSSAPLAGALVLLAGVWVFGCWELARRPALASSDSVRVEILQPAVDQYRKWDRNFEVDILARFRQLLFQPRPKPPDLIVWPEAALPFMADENSEIPLVSAEGRRLKSWQIVGAVSRAQNSLYNAVFLLDADGQVSGTYHKRQLVPFGEFIPAPLKWLKSFIGILHELGDMAPGAAVQPLFETPLGLAAASICYEAAFPRLARESARQGARVLFNLTNDGWYLNTAGPYQHFQINVFRAIENRVWVVRAANTGISAAIDPWGVVTARMEVDQFGRLDCAVPRTPYFTQASFYASHGDRLGAACVILCLALAGYNLLAGLVHGAGRRHEHFPIQE